MLKDTKLDLFSLVSAFLDSSPKLFYFISIKKKLNIGTYSWKYDSWKGFIYPEKKPFNYLEDYSKHYNCVEVDQWFWSLFAADKIVVIYRPS